MSKTQTTEVKPRLASLAKAALYADVSRWTIHRAVISGVLPFTAVFGDRKVDLNDIDALIEKTKVTL